MFLQNTNATGKVLDNATQVTSVAYQSINNLLTSIVEQLPYIASGILVLFVFWIVSKIVKAIFLTASRRTHLDARLRILFSRLIVILILVLGTFSALTVIVPSFRFGDLIAGLGFTSFIVGFATKDILNNLLSGVLILWKQPFHIGDYIFVKDKQGKVEYIGVRATTLRMDDGEQILIPNGEMYSNPLIIRGAGATRRMKLKFSIGYEAETETAKQRILESLGKTEGVVAEPQPTVFITDLTADGVGITIYFWIDTNENSPLTVFDRVAGNVKNALQKSGTEIYPAGSIIVQQPTLEATFAEANGKNDF